MTSIRVLSFWHSGAKLKGLWLSWLEKNPNDAAKRMRTAGLFRFRLWRSASTPVALQVQRNMGVPNSRNSLGNFVGHARIKELCQFTPADLYATHVAAV